jgi:hypothetical protein
VRLGDVGAELRPATDVASQSGPPKAGDDHGIAGGLAERNEDQEPDELDA